MQLQHIKALLPSIEKLLPSTASQAVDNTLSQRAQAQQALQTFQSTVRSLRESYQFDEKTFQQLQIFDTIANTAQTLTQNEAVQQLQTIITTLYRAQPTKKQEGMLMDLTKVFDTNESRQQAARTKIKSAIDQCADSMKSTLLQHLNTLEPTLRPIKPILPTL